MPSIAITQPYEAVYIVAPDLGDEQIGAITTKYRQIVENGGGVVEKTDQWERRRLAYEIKGYNEGIYIVMQFRAKPPVEAELRRIFQISEDQIRFLIIRRDEEETPALQAVPLAAQAAPAAAPEPSPAAETAPVAEAAPSEEPSAPEETSPEETPATAEPALAAA